MTVKRRGTLAAIATVALVMALPITTPVSTPLMSPSVASATPPRDVTGTTVWQMTDDGTDYIFREITIAPGGSTGWHSHPGELFGTVKEGTLIHNRADCMVDGVYFAGQSVAEKGGPGYVHIGRNAGPTPLVLQILYINPAGAPLALDAPDPGCGFS